MSQFVRHPAYLLIEDHLDALGQKLRGVQIVRGAVLWTVTALGVSFTAALVAHFTGQGRLTSVIFALWMLWLVASAAWWVLRPLLFRPRSIEVARLVETRIPDLYNGLTNSVLLARAGDLQDSPWLGPIFEEILGLVRRTPTGQAISLRELSGLFLRSGAVAAIMLLVLLVPPVRSAIHQGWRQMLNPTAFVPRIGSVRILDVQPREITLVAGQPLEIVALAEDPKGQSPPATLLFEDARIQGAQIPAIPADNGHLRYTYRVDQVNESTRFRVEIGGTQSEWCQVNVVRQVKLVELSLVVKPPAYTRKPEQALNLKPDDIARTMVSVLEGSRVELTAVVDVPVRSALLAVDELPPVEMTATAGGQRFTHGMVVMRDVAVAVLLREQDQIIAKLPDPALRIACTSDAPPAIHMRWPAQDTSVPPNQELKVQATIKDDQGVASARVLVSTTPEAPLEVVADVPYADGTASAELAFAIKVPESHRVHGRSVRVQVQATDNRAMGGLVGMGLGAPESSKDTGPQTAASAIYEIRFRDPDVLAREQKEQLDKLRALLMEMIQKQKELLTVAVAWKPGGATMNAIHAGQVELRKLMFATAETFPFDADDRIVQKTLLVLAQNPAKEAVDLSRAIPTEPVQEQQVRLNGDLQSKQRRIIETLGALLSRLTLAAAPTTQPAGRGGDLDNEKEKLKELDEALKKFLAEEKRIMEATATLVKKPVDQYDEADRKLLEELRMAQEKLDAFMQEKISDFSKLAEQDMANASLLKELLEVYSEVTMATDALRKQAVEMAIPAEEMGQELAREIESNLEKWLWDQADRQKWNQEDPLTKSDIPMAELPTELEDMVGELLEQQEDLFEEMEDTAANWADSLDKGAGWDAMDGPIANMSAKGVTGNQLPNNNEMNGRSGEGRSGKSQGEFVEETASGKGGRNTPTRLDPTAFQQGQVKDESKDPVGGATGGGKISGQGGAGLEGPVPGRDLKEKMDRLANKQAELRNKAERLDLDKKLGAYDNFKLMESAAIMRRVESDLRGNRYQNALRRKDILLDKLETSHLLLSGQVHLQRDSTPKMSDRMEDDIRDVLGGQLPPAWSEALKEYYKKLAEQP